MHLVRLFSFFHLGKPSWKNVCFFITVINGLWSPPRPLFIPVRTGFSHLSGGFGQLSVIFRRLSPGFQAAHRTKQKCYKLFYNGVWPLPPPVYNRYKKTDVSLQDRVPKGEWGARRPGIILYWKGNFFCNRPFTGWHLDLLGGPS